MIVLVSGGFDPVHIGHLDLFEHASRYGDVVIALNSDAWLRRKKSYCFMPFTERQRVLSSMKSISGVVAVDDTDGTVCAALRAVKPDFFANGGDRTIAADAEDRVCRELGIKQIFGIGGGKVSSSSELVRRTVEKIS